MNAGVRVIGTELLSPKTRQGMKSWFHMSLKKSPERLPSSEYRRQMRLHLWMALQKLPPPHLLLCAWAAVQLPNQPSSQNP